MKLATFAVPTPLGPMHRVGVMTETGLIDANAARYALLEQLHPASLAARLADAQVPADMISLIGGGRHALDWLGEALEGSEVRDADGRGRQLRYDLEAVELLAPVPRPPGIVCCTMWESHIRKSEARGGVVRWPEPGSPLRGYYKGNATSVVGPGVELAYPSYADALDVECEMAAIIGTGGKDLDEKQAEAAIVGYAIFNDVSVRKRQREEMRLGLGPTKGKDHDCGNVLGPWLVTADEVGDPRDLEMSLHVNGEEWSRCSSAQMAYSFADVVSYLSQGQTLQSGQLVTSGSYPGGCGLDLGRTLEPGAEVELRIERLGSLKNWLGRGPQQRGA